MHSGVTHTQGTDEGPLERPNSVDPYEEHELVIDLDTDTDSSCLSEETQPSVILSPQVRSGQPRPVPARQYRTTEVWFPNETASLSDNTHEDQGPFEPMDEVDLYEEDEEVKRTKRILVSDLTIEEKESYRCRASHFQSKHFGRIRKHISNKHYFGPLVKCKLCEFHSKNINALKAHVFRQHNNGKTKTSTDARNASSALTEPPDCPPPSPPTPRSSLTELVRGRHMTHINITENDTIADERRIDRTPLLRDAFCGKFNQNRATGH